MKVDLDVEIYILAGGLSRRMGQDKSRLQIGRRSMLGQIRATTKKIGFPVRVVRKDTVPKCGPLGGVYTALKATKASAVLFLACDMPFVSVEILHQMLRRFELSNQSLFVQTSEGAGFPFVLRKDVSPVVKEQVKRREFSIQKLARRLKAKRMKVPPKWRLQLLNINTPEDYRFSVQSGSAKISAE